MQNLMCTCGNETFKIDTEMTRCSSCMEPIPSQDMLGLLYGTTDTTTLNHARDIWVAEGLVDNQDPGTVYRNILDDSEDEGICSLCDGTGIGQFGDPDTSTCPRCSGTGEIYDTEKDDCDRAMFEMDCAKDEVDFE
jgi:hypothetical protein